MRRAMTLVEVLASLVLLTLLAGASASMLRSAAQAMPREEDSGAFELAALADAVLADPVAHGIDTPLHELTSLDIPWPDHPARPPARLRVLRSDEPEADHAWLVLEWDGAAVSRWLALPEEGGS